MVGGLLSRRFQWTTNILVITVTYCIDILVITVTYYIDILVITVACYTDILVMTVSDARDGTRDGAARLFGVASSPPP